LQLQDETIFNGGDTHVSKQSHLVFIVLHREENK